MAFDDGFMIFNLRYYQNEYRQIQNVLCIAGLEIYIGIFKTSLELVRSKRYLLMSMIFEMYVLFLCYLLLAVMEWASSCVTFSKSRRSIRHGCVYFNKCFLGFLYGANPQSDNGCVYNLNGLFIFCHPSSFLQS